MKLSVLPARVEELKKSAARTSAINALIRAKAWVPDFDPVEAAQGYPSLKEDGSEFNEDDLRAIKTVQYALWLVNWLKKQTCLIIKPNMTVRTSE